MTWQHGRHLQDRAARTLLDASSVRIERIISHGHASPTDFWYDQDRSMSG